MAGSPLLGLYNPNAKRKKNYGDTVTPLIASLIGNTIKDTAVSSGQITNEMANRGVIPGIPAAAFSRRVGGQDWLANLVGRVNRNAGESMKGEVTPMDFVNVASVLPIPAGAGVRTGLTGLRLATKFTPRALKGGQYSTKSIQPSIMARVAERTMASPFTESIGEGILAAPAVPQVWENEELSTGAKIGITGGILGGILSPSLASGLRKTIKTKSLVKQAKKNIDNKVATKADYVIYNMSRVKASDSDLTLAMDTRMPEPAMAALTIGQSGDAFKTSVRLYETDSDFKSIIDDLSSGNITAKQATDRYNSWKAKIPKGSRPPFIPTHSFNAIYNYVNTGRLSSKTTGKVYRTEQVRDPYKIDRLNESLQLNPIAGGVGDTRDLRLYDALVETGLIKGQTIGGDYARKINAGPSRAAMRKVDEWIKETYGVTSPARMAAIREELYQAIGHSGIGLNKVIF